MVDLGLGLTSGYNPQSAEKRILANRGPIDLDS